jgi:putative FmdB family regulatory protein
VPVYEYRCKKCNKEFEYTQRMADPPKKKCEACGGVLERLISQTSFQLKGSGWYKDLYSSPKTDTSSSSSDAASTSTTVPAADSSAATAAPAPASPPASTSKKKGGKPAKAK